MITRQVRISGRVQGVGYRDAMRCEAARLGLTGWVRNRRDGSVEAVIQGPHEPVDALIAWAHRGPPASRVEEVRLVETGENPARFTTFELRPTT